MMMLQVAAKRFDNVDNCILTLIFLLKYHQIYLHSGSKNGSALETSTMLGDGDRNMQGVEASSFQLRSTAKDEEYII